MKKNTARWLFTGDNAQTNAKWFFENLVISKFFACLELDDVNEDTVTIEFSQGDPLSQYQLMFTLLEPLDSYRLVGAICPHYNTPNTRHDVSARYLINFHGPNGDAEMCMGCRRRYPPSHSDGFMNHGELKTAMQLEMIRHIRPMRPPGQLLPVPPNGVIASKYELPKNTKTELMLDTGRTSYKDLPESMKMKQIPRPPTSKERNQMTKDTLGSNYATLEIATLFHSLGMSDTIDVKTVKELEHGMEGGEWLDQGGGAVLLMEPEDGIRAKSMITSWMRRNEGTSRYVLAVVELDKAKINTSVINSPNMRQTAAGFAKMRADRAASSDKVLKSFTEPLVDDRPPPHIYRKGRAVGKSTDGLATQNVTWAKEATELRESLGLREDQAKALIESYYKAWPSLKDWHALSQLTLLTSEKERLEIDLQDEKEGHECTRRSLDNLRKEVNDPTNDPDVVKASDNLLRFLAGLNMQDHSIQEQREFNEKFHALKNALMSTGIGATPTTATKPTMKAD